MLTGQRSTLTVDLPRQLPHQQVVPPAHVADDVAATLAMRLHVVAVSTRCQYEVRANDWYKVVGSEVSRRMDDPNITMEEYIRLKEEKAQKCRKVFSWETAKYCKIWYDEDLIDLRSVETEFPAIVFNDNLTSNGNLFVNPRSSYGVSIYKYVYTDADIADFETKLARIYRREVHRVQVFDFGGLPNLLAEGLSTRMLMKHMDAQGQSVFTSRAWKRLFNIRGPLVHELILEFFCTFRFGEAVLDLDMIRALMFQLGRVRRRIVRDLPVIDMAELEGDAGGVDEEASVAPGGGDEDKEMPQAVPPLPRT
ncbi:hypothetical protein Tco_0559165 [Tanacetum coccineum]